MNLVLITSVINTLIPSVYSAAERMEQTLVSIQTVKNKIPNSYIVILEGSKLDDDKFNSIKNSVDELFYINVSGLSKTIGEITMLNTYFNCDEFNKRKHTIDSLCKLSGRYHLNNNFKFIENDMCMVKKTDISWSGKGTYDTRFYKIPKILIDNYINNFKKLYNHANQVQDIEHGFYEYELIPNDKIEPLYRLGVSGNYGPTGEYVED
jgi:hypothetical protein